jgi:hypothetical protein
MKERAALLGGCVDRYNHAPTNDTRYRARMRAIRIFNQPMMRSTDAFL